MGDPGNSRRIRITFGKRGALKYIGHLDLAKTWERVLRRAQINLTYSQGFVSRPHIQFASPLPLGITSECELIDVWLGGAFEIESIVPKVNAVSPPGLPIYSAVEVPDRGPALQTLVHNATYRISFTNALNSVLETQVNDLLIQPTIIRTRREKNYDLRPLIIAVSIIGEGVLSVALSANEQTGVARADEFIDALGYNISEVEIHRFKLSLSPSETV